MDVEGTASPEWDSASREQAERNNTRLSQLRADAVLEAIFAAAGKPGERAIAEGKDVMVVGKGSKPFKPEFADVIFAK